MRSGWRVTVNARLDTIGSATVAGSALLGLNTMLLTVSAMLVAR